MMAILLVLLYCHIIGLAQSIVNLEWAYHVMSINQDGHIFQRVCNILTTNVSADAYLNILAVFTEI